MFAFVIQTLFGESSVYRDEFYLELTPGVKPIINISTAGMPAEILTWKGTQIKIRVISELPLIIETDKFGEEFWINQDDSFAISLLSFDMFRYKLTVYLPQSAEYKRLNITTAGGNVILNGKNLDTSFVQVETKNASVYLNNVNAESTVKTQSGNIYTDCDFYTLPVFIETKSGRVEVKIPDYASIELIHSTKTGKITGGFTEKGIEPIRLHVITESGDLVIIEKDTSLPENYPVL
jgi:hypothetical protein